MVRAALVGSFLMAALASGSGQEPPIEAPLDAGGLPIPAWQASPELADEWRRFAGRYIFQRACTTCHTWGPTHLDNAGWRSYLEGFPANHEPDVREEYGDLTAQFSPGRMVPTREQQTDALSSFLLNESAVSADPGPGEVWDGLPRVGQPAPDFTITDLAGRIHTPSGYRGNRRLVLVFSRAHW